MSKYLKALVENNPSSKYSLKDGNYTIENIWNDESIVLNFKKGAKISFLENIIFPEQLFAIFDKKKNRLEFIYSLIDSDSKLLKRKFEFIYKNEIFNCFFLKYLAI
uniref:Uncharacterized protein n=1 Tax=Chryseobacterium endophyticum TaxID=1854762 RepID=A0AAU6WUG9_9FLAO